MRAAVVTISDRSVRGERPDMSGPILRQLLATVPADVTAAVIIPDDVTQIAHTLIRLADEERCDLIVTTGGTGIGVRDVTPEATRQVIEKELPAMALAIHQESLKKTPYAMLSRAVAGVRGQTLIVNLPGSPKAVQECFAVMRPVLTHAVQLLHDENPYASHPAQRLP